jgi:uncharacterized protein (DUF2235 family)
VVLLDGTLSSLAPGRETNIGLTYRLLQDLPDDAPVTLYYEPGLQWRGYRRALEVLAGVGINRQIKRCYLFLARNYRPGDTIVLMGYSRGAYAVRSLAGLIDKMGLLRPAQVEPETLARVYDCYRTDPGSAEARALRTARCHAQVPIRFMGVYDTVRALGMRWLGLGRVVPLPHPYHSHDLGPATDIARHALALNERRDVYAPVPWETGAAEAASGRVVQVWFRGSHGDVGGQLDGVRAARPLANIPLVWMLGEAEAAGLPLPLHWRNRFVTDPDAPSIGMNRGFGKLFLVRHRRRIGADPSEHLHPTAQGAAEAEGVRLPLHPASEATRPAV